MADDENEENKQPTLSGVKIDPPDLKFPVTLNKSSKQQLRVSVSSAAENGVTFKIKTTNPKRYSVRPNVGVAWPGADAEVTVQLAALKEPPEAKCKDKFQVLSLPLSAEHSQQLKELADEPHRALLNEIWKGDGAKEAQIAKIRCSFVAEPAPRSETIPEEGPVSPFSPEPTVAAAAAATPAAATPAAAPTPSVAGTPAGGSSTTAEELQARARNSCRAILRPRNSLTAVLRPSTLQAALDARERAHAAMRGQMEKALAEAEAAGRAELLKVKAELQQARRTRPGDRESREGRIATTSASSISDAPRSSLRRTSSSSRRPPSPPRSSRNSRRPPPPRRPPPAVVARAPAGAAAAAAASRSCRCCWSPRSRCSSAA